MLPPAPHKNSSAHVLLVCSGLDHARRGFESFARECFEALYDEPGVYIELVKGSGPRRTRERAVPTLRRNRVLARALGRGFRTRPFRLEALAFAFSLQPLLARRNPDVVYLSEWDTARGLAAIRSATRQRFKLLLCNGTSVGEGFDHLDRVQDLTPAAHEYVMERGADPHRHTVLPLGFRIERQFAVVSAADRYSLRERLRLPADRRILVSVAALNRQDKRLDYVIDEVAAIPDPRPFLLLVGQSEAETPGLRSLASERLGDDGHSIRTVPAAEVADLCRASDAFVLASLREGLPRALIEASALGLPCLTHAYPITAFALGPHGYNADLRVRGGLVQLLASLSDDDFAPSRAAERHRYAYEQFSWDRLKRRYVALLRDVAGSPAPDTGDRGSAAEKL